MSDRRNFPERAALAVALSGGENGPDGIKEGAVFHGNQPHHTVAPRGAQGIGA